MRRTHICKNLNTLCTVDCPNRDSCKVTRTPLLIHTIVIHYKQGRIYPDEYINDIAVKRCKHLSDVCPSSELETVRNNANDLKLNGI